MTQKISPEEIIQKFSLEKLLPEGGYFRQSYKSPQKIKSYGSESERSLATCIYYLLTEKNQFHTVKSDEIFHFYNGAPAELFLIDEQGNCSIQILSNQHLEGHLPQVLVPKNTYQAMRLLSSDPEAYAFMGTTVFPGFEYEDFKVYSTDELLKKFPHLSKQLANF
ncbi:MAG: cupin domain-containing protein [Bdellovibrionota bacterium]